MNKLRLFISLNILAALVLISLYAFQIVRINEYNYQAQLYHQQIVELKQSLHDLENVYASSSSLNDLWPMINELELEEVDEITYISIDDRTFTAQR
ncbi:MAG TPA: hypothetical protein PKX21_02250 [Candidatus Pacearchaeota archaeon]|jgi:uncharacterized coiled-coil DUF342 family protein|nr:hypothetical protein [Candidatus Pacearchaeota archaeon]